jgi:MFS family permease
MALTSNIVLLLIAATILGITTKGTNPVRFILVGDAVKTEDARNAFAIDSVFDNAGSLIAPVFFGIIGDAFGTPAIFIGFTIASFLAIVPATIYYRLNNRTARSEPSPSLISSEL